MLSHYKYIFSFTQIRQSLQILITQLGLRNREPSPGNLFMRTFHIDFKFRMLSKCSHHGHRVHWRDEQNNQCRCPELRVHYPWRVFQLFDQLLFVNVFVDGCGKRLDDEVVDDVAVVAGEVVDVGNGAVANFE